MYVTRIYSINTETLQSLAAYWWQPTTGSLSLILTMGLQFPLENTAPAVTDVNILKRKLALCPEWYIWTPGIVIPSCAF